MNAKEFINQVKQCQESNWKNSDISKHNEKILEEIAEHYEACESCRTEFNTVDYEHDSLIDLCHQYGELELLDWICEEEK